MCTLCSVSTLPPAILCNSVALWGKKKHSCWCWSDVHALCIARDQAEAASIAGHHTLLWCFWENVAWTADQHQQKNAFYYPAFNVVSIGCMGWCIETLGGMDTECSLGGWIVSSGSSVHVFIGTWWISWVCWERWLQSIIKHWEGWIHSVNILSYSKPLGGRRYAYRNVWRQRVCTLPSGYHYCAVYGGYRTSRIGEWRLNHLHSMNHAKVINASLSDSSAEIDYM